MKLTKELLNSAEMERQAIKWIAPSWKGYKGVYGGMCIINYVAIDDAHPMHTTPIYGHLLDEAFMHNGQLYYHDGTREVEFEFINA